MFCVFKKTFSKSFLQIKGEKIDVEIQTVF